MVSSQYNYMSTPVVPFLAEEGARTVSTGEDSAGGERPTYTWADKIAKGNLLKMDATNSRDLTVMNRTVSDSTLIGTAHDKPRYEDPDSKAWLADAANPAADEQRTVGVEVMAAVVKSIEIDDGGTLPTILQSVQPSAIALGLHVWDRDTTLNNTRVVGVGTLGAVDTVVMFDYWGSSW